MNTAERHLAAEMHRAADDMAPSHLDPTTVIAAAQHTGHRPVRTVVLAVAATVVAIALPVTAVVVIKHLSAQTPPVTVPTSLAPAPTELPSATPETRAPKTRVTFSLDQLPTGAPPALPYSFDGTIYPVGAPPVTLAPDPGKRLASFARYGSGWIALFTRALPASYSEDIRVFDAQGQLIRSIKPAPTTFARRADGSVAVSLQPGQITLVNPAGTSVQTWTVPGSTSVMPIAVLADGSVVAVAKSIGAILARPDGTLHPFMASGLIQSVNSVNGDVTLLDLAHQTCLVDYGIAPLGTRWEACPYWPGGTFSPDGRYFATTPEQPVRLGSQSIAVLNARTGAVTMLFAPPMFKPGPYTAEPVYSIVWEDDTHILAFVQGRMPGSPAYAIRFGLDGTVEKAGTVALSTSQGLGTDGSPPAFER